MYAWQSDYCLMPNEQFVSYIKLLSSDDDYLYFVLDQHTLLDLYSANSLTQ